MTRAALTCALLVGTLTACTDGSPLAGLNGGWSTGSHPCFGHRTDVMWFDDADNGWVGCGSTTEGYGLYSTGNGGSSWSSAGGLFDGMRVNSIHRADDGRLFVGGTGDAGLRIAQIDGGSASAWYSKPESGAQTWQTFQVGTFRTTSDGRGVSESLTGSDVMVFASTSASLCWW